MRQEELDRCFEARELFLLYQPKVMLQTGMLQGVEALVRWNTLTRGIISPDQFIPLAEQTGLIEPLTDFVFAEAIHQQKVWADAGLDVQLAVNLSASSLRHENLADTVALLCQSETCRPAASPSKSPKPRR